MLVVSADSPLWANRAVWETASEKYVREYDRLLEEARTGQTLADPELAVLRPILSQGPVVVHLQSGHGLDDIALARAGAQRVVGLDYSTVAISAAARRARELAMPCHYVVAALPPTPLADGCADLVYTGKGALVWMPDLRAWASDVARLLNPGGHLFVHEAHPMVPLYSWDPEMTSIRPGRSYFSRSHVNDTFPGGGALEWQWTLGEIVTAVAEVGLGLVTLIEHPEPFWRPGKVEAAAWKGQLPNSYSLLACRRAQVGRGDADECC
jgi:ubiquinone/menaquinone biosynthesis C-methylase UbiE